MNLSDITTKPWILALFKRDDGERFLLGDGYYDFKDSLQHFQPNSMSNDIVELQGADGQLLAGQVRRSGTQSFDGYIGDGTTNRKIVEQRRKAFLMFFRKKHYYTVVYIFCDGTAIKRERGYLVDAPSVPEIRQKSPEYHVALNFENVNYYEYAENADGDEIYSNVREIVVSNLISGGLVWDALGTVSEALQWGDYTTESGSFITLNDVIQNAPMSLSQIKGNAEQNGTPTPDAPVPIDVVTGEQSVSVVGKNLATLATSATKSVGGLNFTTDGGYININGTATSNANFYFDSFKLPTNDTATFSVDVSGYTDKPTSNSAVILQSSPDNSNWSSAATIWLLSSEPKSASITLDSSLYYRVRFYVTASSVFTNATIKVQLEKGSATTFEPYQSQVKTVNLGKNLLQGNSYSAHGIDTVYDATTGTFSISGTPDASAAIISANIYQNISAGTYTLSTTEKSTSYSKRIRAFHADNTYDEITIYANTTSATGTFTADIVRYNILVTNLTTGVFVSDSFKLQLERGSVATDWALYFTPIELAKIPNTTYEDAIFPNVQGNDYYDENLEEGKWYIHKAVGKAIFDGSEAWAIVNTGTDRFYYRLNGAVPDAVIATANTLISNYGSWGGVGDSNTNIGIYIVTAGGVRIRYGTEMTLANWKAKLATTNMVLYYALATATDTEITDATLLAQLEHIYQLYGGVNNISIVGAGNGSIEISYATELNPGGGFVWEDGGTGGLTTITIDAVDLTLPVWTITGPATNPTLSNITTGQTMSWLGTVPSGQTLIIDMDEQTATMAGANVYAFLSGNWVGLAPGTNRISYSVTGTDESSTLSWNNIVG